jgi:hypothetical protein
MMRFQAASSLIKAEKHGKISLYSPAVEPVLVRWPTEEERFEKVNVVVGRA